MWILGGMAMETEIKFSWTDNWI